MLPFGTITQEFINEDGKRLTFLLNSTVRINPAFDYIGNEIYLTVALPALIQSVENENSKPKGIIALLTVSTKLVGGDREKFPCEQSEFIKRQMIASIPNSIPELRMSSQLLNDFINNVEININPFVVYESVKAKFRYLMDHSEEFASVDTVYAIASYFYILFPYFPYLKIGGQKGSGKTKLGVIFGQLCFNAKKSDSLTAPAIFRFAQDTRGTFVIDESEDLAKKSDQLQAIRKILLGGFHVGGEADRINENTKKPETFKTYGPKIIISIAGVEEVLEDRCIEQILQKTQNFEISARQPNTLSPEWQGLRDSLYRLLFSYFKEVSLNAESIQTPSLKINGRLWDLAKPLITIARFIDHYAPEGKKTIEQVVIQYIEREVDRKEAEQIDTLGSAVITATNGMLREGSNPIEIVELCLKIQDNMGYSEPPSSKSILTVLKNLHLIDTSKKPDRKGTNGRTRYSIAKEQLDRLVKLPDEDQPPVLPSQTSTTSELQEWITVEDGEVIEVIPTSQSSEPSNFEDAKLLKIPKVIRGVASSNDQSSEPSEPLILCPLCDGICSSEHFEKTHKGKDWDYYKDKFRTSTDQPYFKGEGSN